MNCSISGEVPEETVVSKKSGLLYEKRLIVRHITDYGKCPITGEPLTMEDIVPVKTGKIVKPRSLTAASIPGMLGMFQNEWDALTLSNFALEQQLHTARQELSHSLYQVVPRMAEKACVKRLQKEYRALCKEPVSHVVARPSSNDILEWHYVLEGSEGTPFAGGFYYGKIKFPPDIPTNLSESLIMITPNGRFMTQKKICLSMSDS